MQAPAPPPVPSSSNASPPTPINLVPSEGFALRDATIYRFVDLCVSPTALQRPGAYAIRGPSGVVQYMGYSKNIASKLFLHQRLLPHACLSFQVYVPSVPTELMSPELLESVLEYWVAEIGSVPDGNTVDRHLWENNNPDHRKVLLTSIFSLFLFSSILKQFMYYNTRY